MMSAVEAPLERALALQTIAEQLMRVQLATPLRVAIDGPSAAGKTTLADELAELLRASGREVIRVSLDDYHRPTEERYRRGKDSPEGYYLDAIDNEAFVSMVLEPLEPDGNRLYTSKLVDRARDGPIALEPLLATDDAIALIDGVFLFRPELNRYWDYRIYVDVSPDAVLQRAIRRDVAWLGTIHEVLERYCVRYLPGEALYVKEIQPQTLADLVMENSHPAYPELQFRRG